MTRRIVVVNFNAHWMTKFWTRAEDICRELRKQKVDMILAQELATYNNAEHVSELMGWGGHIVKDDKPKANSSCVLHGDFVPVATGIIWNPDKFDCDATGMIRKSSHQRNRCSTWGHFRFEGEGIHIASDHAEFEPKGPNTSNYWNNVRYKQMDGLLDQLKKPGRSVLVGGDMNDALKDGTKKKGSGRWDGSGKAAREHNMRDGDTVAVRRYNTDRTLAKAGWTKGGRILRTFTTPDIKIPLQNTINMHDWTDHNALLIDIGW